MAEETKLSTAVAAPAPANDSALVPAVVENPDKAEGSKPEPEPEPSVVEKEVATEAHAVETPAPDVVEKAVPAIGKAGEVVAQAEKDEGKVAESGSFKEESNVVADLPNPQQKALDELKKLVEEALRKHELIVPPPPPPAAPAKVVEEEKKPEPESSASPAEDKKETETEPEPEPQPKSDGKKELEAVPESKTEEKKESQPTTAPPPEPETEKPVATKVVEVKVEQKVETVADDATKTVEEIKDIVEVTTSTPLPPPVPAEATEEKPAREPESEKAETTPPYPPEEISIWGVKLLEDERSDTILLKFLRARDFKVKEAFTMLKNVVAWRKQFGIDELLEEEENIVCEGLNKAVYLHGTDREGHKVIYNGFGEFQDKELYANTFGDAEKRSKFLKAMILFLEKSIRNLDFSPDGICTLFQVIDLKNSPGLFFFKKDLRQAINQALQLFQDNYPEFVAKQVYINVPWWYPTYYRMTNAIFTPRTKSKFVFAGPSRSAETLFKYIAPEKVPVQYGGLSREDEQEFTAAEVATDETIKPASKHKVEFAVTENCILVWELRVVGWDVNYGAEFVPNAEEGYTVIVQKSSKISTTTTDGPIISTGFNIAEPGKIVITINNLSSKRKKLLYRSKTKPSD